jgi:hypothetical protein
MFVKGWSNSKASKEFMLQYSDQIGKSAALPSLLKLPRGSFEILPNSESLKAFEIVGHCAMAAMGDVITIDNFTSKMSQLDGTKNPLYALVHMGR